MNIKTLVDKFKDSLPDRTLLRDLEIEVKVINVPEKSLTSGYIILGDDTGFLEAVAPSSELHGCLKSFVKKAVSVKLKGKLGKTEYGNIAFEIEEVIE